MTNLDRLLSLGLALHGERWQRAVARDLDINQRQVQRWVSGQYDIPAWAITALVDVARLRRDSLDEAVR